MDHRLKTYDPVEVLFTLSDICPLILECKKREIIFKDFFQPKEKADVEAAESDHKLF